MFARVSSPIIIGDTVDAIPPKVANTPLEIFLTLIGYISVIYMNSSPKIMDIANLNTNIRANCI